MAGKRASYTYSGLGRGLETVVAGSQADVVRIEQTRAGAKAVRRPDGAMEFRAQKGPPDFVGTILRHRWSLFFDAKECSHATRFDVGSEKRLREHQRQYLMRQGDAGAVAGVLVEAKAVKSYLWLWHFHLRQRVPSIGWSDPRWLYLGDTQKVVAFRLLVADAERRFAEEDAAAEARRLR